MQINSFIVKKLSISHHEVQQHIEAGHVLIDGKKAVQKQSISSTQTITFKSEILQEGKQLFYYAYHKPVGVESTLNKAINNNLIDATRIESYFFPIGRLDKASEGLMVLTNDGELYQHITKHSTQVEKIYEVQINKSVSNEFIIKMETGVSIMGQNTRPCKVSKIGDDKFEITLIEGRNRQIRRMCYQLGVDVLVLKRIAIGKLRLGEIDVNSYIEVSKDSIV